METIKGIIAESLKELYQEGEITRRDFTILYEKHQKP